MTSDSLLSSVFSRQRIITTAGIAAAAFIGYCIYFNYKRRSAPDYRQRIEERRRIAARERLEQQKRQQLDPAPLNAAIEAILLRELGADWEPPERGHIEIGMDHIGNVIVMPDVPAHLPIILYVGFEGGQFFPVLRTTPEECLIGIHMVRTKLVLEMIEGAETGGPAEGLAPEIRHHCTRSRS